ncbi:flagellum-associated coiled-coil domain-containing protein 1 [Ambystoma mexicanum]|uniref:flagellum-associated coiled-coil domain-containing protein 1 n=1 Tax=Ambystoma mexicanum TaxID=8296 RepID=UPI0037E9AC29
MDPAGQKSILCQELKGDSSKMGRLSPLPFSKTPPCSCWQAGRFPRGGFSKPKSCPPLRQRYRSPGMHFDTRASSAGAAAHSEKEHLLISPGYCMTRSKDQISVTLDEQFFGCLSEEDLKPTTSNRFEIRTELEDTVNDLQEQISKLIAMLEQERRDHRETQKNMKAANDEKVEELQTKRAQEVRDLQEAHAAELQSLEARCKCLWEEQKAEMEKSFAKLKEEYEYLESAFRTYKDTLLEEMEDKWQRREAKWRDAQQEEKRKALKEQNELNLKSFEKEKNDVWMNAQKAVSAMHLKHVAELESLQQKYEEECRKHQLQERQQEEAHLGFAKKQEEVDALNESVRAAQLEIEKLKKDLMNAQKDCSAKIKKEEEKHKLALQSMTQANTELRRKLTGRKEDSCSEKMTAKHQTPSSKIDKEPC